MDIKNLTLGEIAKVEEIAGMPLSSLSEDDKPKGKLLAGLGLVIKRREDPKFTLEQANNMTMAEITALLEDGTEAAKK